MRRDMELVRKILMTLEETPADQNISLRLDISGYSEQEIGFHVALMGEAGLIHTSNARHHGQAEPFAVPISITWEGYEFLATARNESVWRTSVSTVLSRAGSVGFELLKAVLMAELRRQMGLP